MASLHNLPLKTDHSGRLRWNGQHHPVRLELDYEVVAMSTEQYTVLRGGIVDAQGQLLMQVAAKVRREPGPDLPAYNLAAEADLHAHAWSNIPHVLRPIGYVNDNRVVGASAVFLTEQCMPFEVYLEQAGPVSMRGFHRTTAIARIAFQLLQFIVTADAFQMMHKDISMRNLFVRNADNAQEAELGVGGFGAAQRAEVHDEGDVTYSAGAYTWGHTSPRLIDYVNTEMVSNGAARENVRLHRQITFYNDMFGWARVTIKALTHHDPPDILRGPCPLDYSRVPQVGHGPMVDAVHHLLHLALSVHTPGHIEELVDADYVTGLPWYNGMPDILDGSDV